MKNSLFSKNMLTLLTFVRHVDARAQIFVRQYTLRQGALDQNARESVVLILHGFTKSPPKTLGSGKEHVKLIYQYFKAKN